MTPLIFYNLSKDIDPLVLRLNLLRYQIQDDLDQDDKALIDLGNKLEKLKTKLCWNLDVNSFEEAHHAHGDQLEGQTNGELVVDLLVLRHHDRAEERLHELLVVPDLLPPVRARPNYEVIVVFVVEVH